MMGIFKIFSSDATLNDQTQMLYSNQFSQEPTAASSMASLSDTVHATNSIEKGVDILPQNCNNDDSSKEILYGSGDGSSETESALATQNSNECVEKIHEYQNRENDLLKELENERSVSQQKSEIIDDFSTVLSSLLQENQRITDQKDVALAHLANIEFGFCDLTIKYERVKQIVVQYQENEEVLRNALRNFETVLKHREEKYQTLKTHATEKLNEANVEIDKLRKTHTVEVAKLNAVIKKSECKVKCLEQQLEQKIAENSQMARLWEDLNTNIQNENYCSDLAVL